ncbi:MAG: glycine dehydrogenase subunit 2 [Chloroflexi bacterium]|nr:glycine dehydrogenase subunit 2 [Chloroflexota bacterium]
MQTEPLIYELSSPGRQGAALPECDVPATPLPKNTRQELHLPEVSEVDVVRHFTRLSQKNYCVDLGIYPLGSCTMKYNPKINEEAVKLPGLAQVHPYQDPETVQGAIQLMFELQQYLAEISGLPGVTLQPAAGAQGELTGVLVIRAYHLARGDYKRCKVLVPDSAHGTNPATSSMSGETVGLMLTNPNTLGLFEENVQEVCKIVHDAGGLVYGDGANLNAIVGVARPGDLGFDVLHSNLHKTFSVPHGGGGPGAGPVMVRKDLTQYLPGPNAVKVAGARVAGARVAGAGSSARYKLAMPKKSIGRVKSFYGNFLALVRAYTYIRSFGNEHLREIAENAVLNANYLLARLKDTYSAPYGNRVCKHEFVLTGTPIAQKYGVHTLDIAKRIEDYGFYPPTIYFPLIAPRRRQSRPRTGAVLQRLKLLQPRWGSRLSNCGIKWDADERGRARIGI